MRSIKNTAGFSIAGALVALVIAGAGMVVLNKLLQSVNDSAANTDLDREFNVISDSLQNLISVKNFCNPQAFLDVKGNPIEFRPNDLNSNPRNYVLPIDKINVGTVLLVEKNSQTSRLKFFKLEFQGTDLAPSDTLFEGVEARIYPTELHLSATREKGTLKGHEMARKILISLVVSKINQQIISCQANVSEFANQFCKSGEFLKGFDTEGMPVCAQLDGPRGRCASNELLQGFSDDGQPLCVALPVAETPIVPVTVPNTSVTQTVSAGVGLACIAECTMTTGNGVIKCTAKKSFCRPNDLAFTTDPFPGGAASPYSMQLSGTTTLVIACRTNSVGTKECKSAGGPTVGWKAY